MFSSGLVIVALVAIAIWHTLRPKIQRNGNSLQYGAITRPADTLPLIGNGLRFLQPRHKLFQWFTDCQRKFGLETYEISVPSLPPGVVISDPQNLEYVLKNEDLFDKGEFFRQRSWDLFGDGIINADGHLWRAQRRAGLHFFRASNLKILIDKVLPQYVAETKSELRRSTKEGEIIDLEMVFLNLTTRLMGEMAYGMSLDASSPFSKAFEYASGATGERFQNPFWKVAGLLFGRRFRESVDIVKAYGRDIVSVAMDNYKSARAKTEPSVALGSDDAVSQLQGSLINSLIDEIESPETIADAALNFLSAGRDTTAQALTWTFYLLMRHPETVKALRREIAETHPDSLCYDSLQIQSLPYTLAVFKESLRIYPPVPFEIKQCQKPTTLPDGTFLPQGAVILWCVWAMNRSSDIWEIDDLESFKPERWLEPENAGDQRTRLRTKTKSNFEFPVFNGGARLCLGRRMAELQAVYVTASLVADFDFEEVQDGKTDSFGKRITRNSLTLPMEGGLPCRVKERHTA